MSEQRKVYATLTQWVQVGPDYQMERRPRVREIQPGETIDDVLLWVKHITHYPQNTDHPIVFTITMES